MQGIELYDEGKYLQAAIAFERAYELSPNYRILWNLAQVENQLEHYAAALMAYTSYLEGGGGEIPETRRTNAEAEIRRLRTLVGTIIITTETNGATVFVDGKRQGDTPLAGPVFVDIGEHEVVLKLGAEQLHREVVRVAGSKEVVVSVTGAVSETPAAMKEPPTDEQPVEEEPAAPPPDDDPQPQGQRVWTWVALGVGAAAGITGGVLGGVALTTKNDIDGDCVDQHCPPSRKSDGKKVEKLALGADILYGVAGAALITGLVLFFMEPGLGQEEDVSVAPLASPELAGVAVSGRF